MDHAPADLVPAMRQTVGALFWSLGQDFAVWSRNGDSQPVFAMGPENQVNVDPLRVNRQRLHQMFVRGVAELEPVLSSILSGSTHAGLKQAAAVPAVNFRYADELWVRTVY
jgi:hypothetical protein